MLPPPTVAIEQSADVPAEIRQAVLDGCAQGLGPAACVDEANLDPTDVPYRAQLIWSADYEEVRVIVSLGAEELEREIEFKAHDPADKRGAAAGIVAATAVATHRILHPVEPSEPENESVPAPAPQRRDVQEVIVPAKEPELRDWRLDVAGVVSSSLREGPLAWGAMTRVSVSGWMKHAFPILALSYAQSGGSIRAGQFRAWLGLGGELPLGDSPFSLELSGACVGERLSLSASREDEVDRANRFRIGGLAEADVVWTPTEVSHFFLGAQASMMWPNVEVNEGSEPVDHEGFFGWSGLGGVRFRL